MLYTLIKLLSRLACWLPPGAARRAGGCLGQVAWLLTPRKRKDLAAGNIQRSLQVPPGEARRLAKASTVRFGPMFVDVLRLPLLTAQPLDRWVSFRGAAHLEDALAEGRGVVLATAHSGNWELLGASLALRGWPLVAVVQKQTNAVMDRFINEYRSRSGMHVTYKSGVKEMIRLLGEGRIIGLLMDQDAGPDGVCTDFFGRPASSPPGAAHLARMREVPIVPAFITQEPGGRYAVTLHPPVRVEKTADKKEDIRRTTQELTRIIEAHVRRQPQDWFWLHNRWKHGELVAKAAQNAGRGEG